MFRPVKIRHYLAAMQSRGFSASDVLAGTGIDASQLNEPAFLVDLPQGRMIVANMIRLTGRQEIGFEIGAEAEFVDLGIVGHALLSSKNCRDAILLWTRYSNALIGMLIHMKLEEQRPDRWTLQFVETAPMGFIYNFCVEELLSIVHKLGSALAGRPIAIERLELSYPAPAHQALYEQHLGCVPEFNCGHTLVSFSEPDLDRALRGRDEEFNLICLQHCSQIMRQIANNSPLISRLRNLLLARPGDIPSLEKAASGLGMSSRTLRRRLEDEGHSYQRLVNQFRFDLAREYLDSSMINVKEISQLIGFKDPDAFRRAFKAWTGKTVGEYRSDKP